MLLSHVYHILSGTFTSPQLLFVSFVGDEVEGIPLWALIGLDAGLEQYISSVEKQSCWPLGTLTNIVASFCILESVRCLRVDKIL